MADMSVEIKRDIAYSFANLSLEEERALRRDEDTRRNAKKEEEEKKEREVARLELSQAALQAMYQQQAMQAKEASDDAADAFLEQGKIMEIARRISRGDKVPPKDEKKLMEYSSELYQMAKMAAMLSRARRRKKHKSLFEDEEEKNELLRALKEDSAKESAQAQGAENGAADQDFSQDSGSGSLEDAEAQDG